MSGRFELIRLETTWSDARDRCTARGAQLAVVRDDDDQALLTSLLVGAGSPANAWLGATDSFKDGLFHWVDGSLVDDEHAQWGPNQPADVGNEDCVVAKQTDSYLWNDVGCDTHHEFVCSPLSPPLPPHPPLPPRPPPALPASPPPVLAPEGTAHYVLSTDIHSPDPGPMQWANAKAYCEGRGEDLAIVRSAADQEALVTLLESHAASDSQVFWLGLARRDDSSFGWVDGSDTSAYTNWRTNRPSYYADCVETYAPMWWWNDVSCTGPRAFVCSSRPPPPAPPAPPQSPSPAAPPPPPPPPSPPMQPSPQPPPPATPPTTPPSPPPSLVSPPAAPSAPPQSSVAPPLVAETDAAISVAETDDTATVVGLACGAVAVALGLLVALRWARARWGKRPEPVVRAHKGTVVQTDPAPPAVAAIDVSVELG